MDIKIAEKLRPFSHTPGVSLLLPLTSTLVQVFPTRVVLNNEEELLFHLHGPISKFTVQLDLEKGTIQVFGQAQEGYFCYFIQKAEGGVEFLFKKAPKEGIRILHAKKTCTLKANQTHRVTVEHVSATNANFAERLSLGMHKTQDWDLVKRRQDLKEILPIWNRLSNLLPTPSQEGSFSLLNTCKACIEKKEKEEIAQAFLNLFNAHFHGILVPRLFDADYQGLISLDTTPVDIPPFFLLQGSGKLLRSLFFQEEKEKLFILPCLPPEFHAGRFINIQTKDKDLLDIECTKKLIRLLIVRPTSMSTKQLIFQKPIKSFRIRSNLKEKGTILTTPVTLHLEPGKTLYLDNFEK